MIQLLVLGGRREQTASSASFVVSFYIAAIVAAEAVTAFVGVLPGVLAHALLVFVLLNHYLFAAREPRRAPNGVATAAEYLDALLALLLVPLLGVLRAALAFEGVPDLYRQALVGAPLLVGIASLAWFLRASWLVELLRIWSWREQAPIALTGVPLSLAAFLIVRPERAGGFGPAEIVVGAAILIVFTGFVEEILFRGLLQHALTDMFARTGLLWSSLLFLSVYLGAATPGYLVFFALLGLVFAWVVYRTRSLLGVAISHGVLNAGMILVWPALLA